jgi:peroxiredoxin
MKTSRILPSVDHLLLALLFISLCGNVYLGIRLLRPVVPAVRMAGPPIGARLSSFEARDLDGQSQIVDPRASQLNTVFYVFSPSCIWCERNLANLQALASAAGTRYRLIGVSLDPNVASYIRQNSISFPVLVRPTAQTVQAYGLGATPQTIVLSPSGTVVKLWQGAYAATIASDVSDFFSIELPGLIQNPTTQ